MATRIPPGAPGDLTDWNTQAHALIEADKRQHLYYLENRGEDGKLRDFVGFHSRAKADEAPRDHIWRLLRVTVGIVQLIDHQCTLKVPRASIVSI